MPTIWDINTELQNNKIEDVKIKYISEYRTGHNSKEPFAGFIIHNDKSYYFQFNNEFDEGNTYIVYDDLKPVFYFVIRTQE